MVETIAIDRYCHPKVYNLDRIEKTKLPIAGEVNISAIVTIALWAANSQ